MRPGDHGGGVRQSASPLPGDALSFSFAPGMKWLMAGAAVFSCAFIALALALALIDPAHIHFLLIVPAVAILGSGGAVALNILSHCRDAAFVNRDGIWFLPGKGGSTFIAWNDVASVRARDVIQRLVITDTTGSKQIGLEYRLEHFDRLRAFVLRHSSAARLRNPRVTTFHRSWIDTALGLGELAFFLFLAYLCVHLGQPRLSIISLGFAGFVLVLSAREAWRVEVSKKAVVIKYIGWQRRLAFGDISNIMLADVHGGSVPAALIIDRRRGKPVKLQGFREGSVALHDALYSARRAYLLLITPRRLTIRNDSFTVEYHRRRFVVPYTAIADIELTEIRNANGTSVDVIKVARDDGGTLRLPGFKEDAPVLYASLREAWLRARGARLGGPSDAPRIDT